MKEIIKRYKKAIAEEDWYTIEKIQKEIILEVTPSDKPDIKPNKNISKINCKNKCCNKSIKRLIGPIKHSPRHSS